MKLGPEFLGFPTCDLKFMLVNYKFIKKELYPSVLVDLAPPSITQTLHPFYCYRK